VKYIAFGILAKRVGSPVHRQNLKVNKITLKYGT